ncbi:hypothetical protein [Eisenbergiella tayi]|uniref:hypothetical protein n=1 Tax=Eisenbergiella tayi TaxID=1432052 RepID=UPI000848BEA3|nr:hypothetical protein [Eisenbergiella tayi]ODR41304.1 hypothetical protein BEI60_06340 [Eisenbergiella tayi]
MQKAEIKLTDNTLENIQIMAPLLNERQQAIVFGVIMGLVPNKSVLFQHKELDEEGRAFQEV